MMAERLAEIRSADNPDFVVELIDYIDELRAQLEAQRGEFSHVEASARYKALGLPDDIQMHAIFLEGWNGGVQARRGGAVVVPELTDIELSACERLARMCRKSPSLVEGYLDDIKPWEAAEAIEKAATRQAIPADRVLADGMVGVDREAITRLSTAIDDVVITSAHHAIGSIEDKAVSVLCMAFSPIAKALRAQQAKGG